MERKSCQLMCAKRWYETGLEPPCPHCPVMQVCTSALPLVKKEHNSVRKTYQNILHIMFVIFLIKNNFKFQGFFFHFLAKNYQMKHLRNFNKSYFFNTLEVKIYNFNLFFLLSPLLEKEWGRREGEFKRKWKHFLPLLFSSHTEVGKDLKKIKKVSFPQISISYSV